MMRIELALDHIDDIKRFDRRIDEITLKIRAAVQDSGTPLTRIYGVGPLTAGLILGEVGDVSRFPTRNHFASYTGTALIAVSSGDNNCHRHRQRVHRNDPGPRRDVLCVLNQMGVMGVEELDLIEGCDVAGAAAFLDFAADADVRLFV
jgi:hypothetical protein